MQSSSEIRLRIVMLQAQVQGLISEIESLAKERCSVCHGSGKILNEVVESENRTKICSECNGTGYASGTFPYSFNKERRLNL